MIWPKQGMFFFLFIYFLIFFMHRSHITLDISIAKTNRGYTWVSCYFGYFHDRNKDRLCVGYMLFWIFPWPKHGEVMHDLHVILDISMAKTRRGYAWVTCYFGYFHDRNKDRLCVGYMLFWIFPWPKHGEVMHDLHVILDISMAKTRRGYAWVTCYFGYFHGQNKERLCMGHMSFWIFPWPKQGEDMRELHLLWIFPWPKQGEGMHGLHVILDISMIWPKQGEVMDGLHVTLDISMIWPKQGEGMRELLVILNISMVKTRRGNEWVTCYFGHFHGKNKEVLWIFPWNG